MKRPILIAAAALALAAAACADKSSGSGNRDAQVLVMRSAYPFYDGYDESSGRYRLAIPLCTDPGATKQPPYIDLLLYIYMKTPPTKPVVLPTGTVTPFYTDGRDLPELVYYIGEHFVDETGAPNARGTAWFVYTDASGRFSSVGCAEAGSFTIARDAASGDCTIEGAFDDATTGRTLRFVYTGDPAVFDTESL